MNPCYWLTQPILTLPHHSTKHWNLASTICTYPTQTIRHFLFIMSSSKKQFQYETRLLKQEARSFHRPALQFPSNIKLRFAKVRPGKKKKDKAGRKIGKGVNVGESLHRAGDLSLKDTSNFVLWAEEHPPIISNFGMGSILVDYYRRKTRRVGTYPRYALQQLSS